MSVWDYWWDDEGDEVLESSHPQLMNDCNTNWYHSEMVETSCGLYHTGMPQIQTSVYCVCASCVDTSFHCLERPNRAIATRTTLKIELHDTGIPSY